MCLGEKLKREERDNQPKTTQKIVYTKKMTLQLLAHLGK